MADILSAAEALDKKKKHSRLHDDLENRTVKDMLDAMEAQLESERALRVEAEAQASAEREKTLAAQARADAERAERVKAEQQADSERQSRITAEDRAQRAEAGRLIAEAARQSAEGLLNIEKKARQEAEASAQKLRELHEAQERKHTENKPEPKPSPYEATVSRDGNGRVSKITFTPQQ